LCVDKRLPSFKEQQQQQNTAASKANVQIDRSGRGNFGSIFIIIRLAVDKWTRDKDRNKRWQRFPSITFVFFLGPAKRKASSVLCTFCHLPLLSLHPSQQCRHATQDARFICLKQSAPHLLLPFFIPYCCSLKVGYVVVVVVSLGIIPRPSPVQIKLKVLSGHGAPKTKTPQRHRPHSQWPNNVMRQSGSTFLEHSDPSHSIPSNACECCN